MNNPSLAFYYYESCPFCVFVLNTINALKVKVDLKHIYNDPSNLKKLVQDTGRRTTPCLYVNERPMFESADIIEWLKNNIDNLEKVT